MANTAYEIKRRRREVGWTRLDLALAAGISEKTVQRIELGHSEGTDETLSAIWRALRLAEQEVDDD